MEGRVHLPYPDSSELALLEGRGASHGDSELRQD